MKNSYLTVALMGGLTLLLASCGESGPIDPPAPTTYNLTLNAETGSSINVTNASEDGRYEAGEVVNFDISVEETNKIIDEVTFNDVVLYSFDGSYSITMPKKDSVIAVTLEEIGPSNLLDPGTVVIEEVPTTVEEVDELLNGEALSANATYLESATYVGNFGRSPMGNTVESYRYESKVGRNGNAVVKGSEFNGSSSHYNEAVFTLTDNYLYGLVGEQDSYDYSETADIAVLSDETEPLNTYEMSRSEASYVIASQVGFNYAITSALFSNYSTESFLNDGEEGWTNITLTSEVETSSYTLTIEGQNIDYYGDTESLIHMTMTVNGNNFISSINFENRIYDEMDINPDTNLPYDGANPSEIETLTYTGVVAYKDEVEGINIDDLVINGDYDVHLSYNIEGTYSTFDAVDNVVEDSGELTSEFEILSAEKALVNPILLGSKEDGKIIFDEDGNAIINGTGTTTLLYDNGAGVIKEVAIEVVTPNPRDISATLNTGEVVYLNETSTLTVSIIPSGANQEATVTINELSTGNVSVEPTDVVGVFNITGKTEGAVTLTYASVADSSIKDTISFDVIVKPDPTLIRQFLTTTTLHGSVSGWGDHFVNFETDGTGEYVCYESGKGDIIPFKWALDDATLTITISDFDPDAKSKYYNLVGFSNPTNDSVVFTFSYNGTDRSCTMTALDEKLDLETADLSVY